MKNIILAVVEKFSYGLIVLAFSFIFWMNATKISNTAWNISLIILVLVTGMAAAWVHEKRTA